MKGSAEDCGHTLLTGCFTTAIPDLPGGVHAVGAAAVGGHPGGHHHLEQHRGQRVAE